MTSLQWTRIYFAICRHLATMGWIVEHYFQCNCDSNKYTRSQICTCHDICNIMIWYNRCSSSKSNFFFKIEMNSEPLYRMGSDSRKARATPSIITTSGQQSVVKTSKTGVDLRNEDSVKMAAAFITVTSNERHDISTPLPLECLFKRLFRLTSEKTSKPSHSEGNPPVTGKFPSQRASNAESVYTSPCADDNKILLLYTSLYLNSTLT